MRPGPEIAMAESAVVSLYAEPELVARKRAAVETDLSRKNRVGVWRAGEADPALITQRHAKRRAVAEIPIDFVSVNLQRSTAGIFVDCVFFTPKVEGSLPSWTDVQSQQRKALNEGSGLAISRKPGCPDLNRSTLRIAYTATPSGIHQQVTKPPCAAAIRQSEAEKPHFIAATDRSMRENFIESSHGSCVSEYHENYLTELRSCW